MIQSLLQPELYIETFKATIIILIAAFGFFFVIGFFLSKLQEWTQNQYQRSIGWYGILWTAWIGTPIHELSHALFAKIFAHRIEEMHLFTPNRRTGLLGQVDHSYNPRNPYALIGNFFIGAAPMIGGCVVLFVLFKYLLPESEKILFNIVHFKFISLNQVLSDLSGIGTLIFSQKNIHSAGFWFFVYLSFSVGVHLAPSSYDQKTMWRGFAWLFIFLYLILLGVFYFNGNSSIKYQIYFLPFLSFAFIYSLILSTVHLITSTIILFPIRLLRR
jgi:hypothetical protein